MYTNFWSESLKGEDHLKSLDVDGNQIRNDLREIVWERMDWMHLVQERDQWRTVVDTAT
jgi:hypothetical protein